MRSKLFIKLTYSRFRDMNKRSYRKGMGFAPFSLPAFRDWVEHTAPDDIVHCPYCKIVCTLSESAVDHDVPLGRNGELGFLNLDIICKACNDRKGQLTSVEFFALLSFLEIFNIDARQDILRRLQVANQLAAGQAWQRKRA